jgi:hypothetical protein
MSPNKSINFPNTNLPPSIGNELTPSAKYNFKSKYYAPWVFRDLRKDHFHLDPTDYLLSITSKYILSELGSQGNSGSYSPVTTASSSKTSAHE